MFDQLLLRQAGDHVAEDGIAIAVVFSVDLMATGVCFIHLFGTNVKILKIQI
jgi:hypothetical protein